MTPFALSTPILATYIALACTVLSLWLPKHWWAAMGLFAVALGYTSGVLTNFSAVWLALLMAAAVGTRSERRGLRWSSLMALLVIALALGLHVLPGFNNPKVMDDVQMSVDAVPYSMYLNFDKTAAGIVILALCYPRGALNVRGTLGSLARAAPIMIATIVALILLSYLAGYIRLDPKWNSWFLLWAPVNLLFTCMSEEAFFRGLIQREIQSATNSPWLALVIAATLFGVAHFGGGWTYVLLSTLAGLGYGLVYWRSQRIELAILTHFLVNATHFLLFTYPSAA